jgi:hypothetical protein
MHTLYSLCDVMKYLLYNQVPCFIKNISEVIFQGNIHQKKVATIVLNKLPLDPS